MSTSWCHLRKSKGTTIVSHYENLVPIYAVDIEAFHQLSKNFDPLVVLEDKSGSPVIRILPLDIFQSEPKLFTN